MTKYLVAIAATALCASAWAKLPAPTPEAKAKAAETAAKAAWQGKVDGFQLCNVQDRVVAKYRTSATAAGKTVPPAVSTPPCTDPGPFVYAPEAPKPIEAAGAHSPAATVGTPPVTTPQTQAEVANAASATSSAAAPASAAK